MQIQTLFILIVSLRAEIWVHKLTLEKTKGATTNG